MGDVHIQIATQNVKLMFWVGMWVRTAMLWHFCHAKMNIFTVITYE